jgi:hypothetical protein
VTPSPASLEDAIRVWLTTGSGLAAGQVYLLDQDLRRTETTARIGFRLGDGRALEGTPELQTDYNAGRPAGQEVQYTAHTPRELVVSVQAFAPVPADGASSISPARNLLEDCRAALGLPSVRDALNAAGLGVMDAGNVQRIPKVTGATFEDRAVLDVRFNLTVTATEKTGYIASVAGQVTVSGVVKTFTKP